MKEALRRKIGPFPAWAWLGFVLLLALVLWIRRRNAAKAAAAAADPNATGDGGPSTAAPGNYDQAMIPAGSPGSPASGTLPIDLIVTFQNAGAPSKPKLSAHQLHVLHQQHLNARRGVPAKLTPHQLHVLHQEHMAHVGA